MAAALELLIFLLGLATMAPGLALAWAVDLLSQAGASPMAKIGDLLNTKKSADADAQAKAAALAQAQADSNASNAAAATADATFAQGVKALGTVVDPATLTVYTSPDGVDLHTTKAVDLTADVPDATPAPAATAPAG